MLAGVKGEKEEPDMILFSLFSTMHSGLVYSTAVRLLLGLPLSHIGVPVFKLKFCAEF